MQLRRAINSIKNLNARHRLLLSIGAAAIVFSLLPSSMLFPTRILVTWDFGILFLLSLIGVLVSVTTPPQMRDRVQNQDEKPSAILALVISAASASFFAIGFILSNAKGLPPTTVSLHVALSVIAIFCSWLLTHTAFALHYAHNYYRKDDSTSERSDEVGGLNFPDEEQPDYWDFLYFSLVIGMTSQVSDVTISSRSRRRLATVH